MENTNSGPHEEDPNSWSALVRSTLVWASQDPWTFVFNIFICLSPFLLISLYLSFKLSRAIENQKKDKKKKVKRDTKMKKKKSKEG